MKSDHRITRPNRQASTWSTWLVLTFASAGYFTPIATGLATTQNSAAVVADQDQPAAADPQNFVDQLD